MGEGARDLVLPGDQLPRLQLGGERELLAALGTEAIRPAGLAVAAPAHGVAALGAGALVFGYLGVGDDRLRGVDGRCRRDHGQAGAEPGSAHPLGAGAEAARGGRTARALRADRGRLDLAGRCCGRDGRGDRVRLGGGGAGGRAAHVAVPVKDVTRAPGLGARGAVGHNPRVVELVLPVVELVETRGRGARGAGGRRHPAHVAVAVDDRPCAAGLLAAHAWGAHADSLGCRDGWWERSCPSQVWYVVTSWRATASGVGSGVPGGRAGAGGGGSGWSTSRAWRWLVTRSALPAPPSARAFATSPSSRSTSSVRGASAAESGSCASVSALEPRSSRNR